MDWDEMEEELDELEDLYFLSADEKRRKAGRGGCLGMALMMAAAAVAVVWTAIELL